MTMRWLVVVTVVEIVAFVGVLAAYLIVLTRQLKSISANLARIAWGVRAVETQVSKVTPGLEQLNDSLAAADRRLGRLVDDASDAG